MKSILIAALLLLICSCGNNKLRLKRVTSIKKQKIIAVDDDKRSTEQNQIITAEIEKSSSQTLESESSSEPIDEVTLEKSILHLDEEEIEAQFPVVVNDSIASGNGEKDQNEAIAKKAEDLSTVAVWLNRGAIIVLLLTALVSLLMLDTLPLLIGSIVGFLMSVTAVTLGFVSRSKSHNTELGSRQSIRAIIIGFVLTGILGFILLLFAEI